jgi:hypothetical protein
MTYTTLVEKSFQQGMVENAGKSAKQPGTRVLPQSWPKLLAERTIPRSRSINLPAERARSIVRGNVCGSKMHRPSGFKRFFLHLFR